MAIDESDFSSGMFKQTKALLVTGTHCSNQRIFEVTKKAVTLAKKENCKVILDIDYRPVLWGVAGHGQGEERYVSHKVASDRLSEIFELCDLIVGTEEEILVAANTDKLDDALTCLRDQTSALLVQKRGDKGCIAYHHNTTITSKPYPVNILNVLGAGDAFMSGFLRGWLKDLPLEECCKLANANGALVVTRHGCAPAIPYWEELQYYMEHPSDLKHTEHLHRSKGFNTDLHGKNDL